MKKILTVVGARPHFIKAGALSPELRKYFKEVLVHTGQHYDSKMSEIFFTELSIPEPDYNLGVGSAPHGKMTGEMLSKIEKVILNEEPDAVLVYGDTNSSLAGALAAVKLHIPIAHVEAGLRSYNRNMPEEINRILADQVSTWLFVPSKVAKHNLENENINKGIFEVGDIMFEMLLANTKKAGEISNVLKTNQLTAYNYCVATVHRAENTDDKEKLSQILDIFASVKENLIFSIHPRTQNKINSFGLTIPKNVSAIEPLGYLDMLELMQKAKMVFTDSGGVQKDAYYLNVPCMTLREETEWIETVEVGWNFVVGTDKIKVERVFQQLDKVKNRKHPLLYGDGTTAKKITDILCEHFKTEAVQT
jgi:UDP-N-acetylglucosamine 2-epimerase